MDAVGESSSTQKEVGEKPVIVRVKRKVGQSPLDAFWLEINERPFKRPLLDLSKLSISDSEIKEDIKPKKVLVRHLETVTDSETTTNIIHSLFEFENVNEHSCSKGKFKERKIDFKKDNKKEQRLTKAVQQQQIAAGNARFEQIWRSRKGNKEDIHDKKLLERCDFYDIIRVDTEEKSKEEAPEFTSLEDQKLLASFLPLLRECIPIAAEEIESDIQSSHTEEYVYDYYGVNEEMDISEEDSSNHQLPLVKVEEEEEFCVGSDESDYDSDDSNAEHHPKNDYPEEISEDEEEEEEEEEDEDSEEEEEEETKSEDSDESEKDQEIAERHVRRVLGDDEFDGYEEDFDVYGESDEEEFESTKWSYR